MPQKNQIYLNEKILVRCYERLEFQEDEKSGLLFRGNKRQSMSNGLDKVKVKFTVGIQWPGYVAFD